MTEQEIRLRCAELAVDQVRRENSGDFKNRVAELATWFYSLTIDQPKADPATEKPRAGRKQDKVPGSIE